MEAFKVRGAKLMEKRTAGIAASALLPCWAVVASVVVLASALPSVGRAQRVDQVAVFDTAWQAMARTYFDTVLVQGRWRVAYDSLRADLGSEPTIEQTRIAIRALIKVP